MIANASVADGSLTFFDIAGALAELPDREREVLVDRLLLQRTLEEIAESLGITRARVRQIEMRANWRLRRALA